MQLISANVNGESFADPQQIVQRLLRPSFTRAHLLVFFALQETRSWDVENLSFPGFASYSSKFGLTTPGCLGSLL